MKPRFHSATCLSLPLATALAAVLGSPTAQAATHTWDGGATGTGANNSWGQTDNWNPNGVPPASDQTDIIFYSSGTRLSNYTGQPRTIRSLTFNAAADSNVTIRTTTTATGTTSANLTFDTDTVGGNATITVDAGAAGNHTVGTGAGSIVLNDNLLITHNGTGTLTLGRPLTGAFSLTKSGASTLILSGASTFSGGSTIDAGTISFSSTGLGGSGNITFGGDSTLRWGNNTATDLSSRLVINNGINATLDTGTNNITLATGFGGAGSGALTKAGAGILTLAGTNTYTGATTVSAGTLTLSGTGSINDCSGITINGSGAKLLQNSSTAVSPVVTLTQGTLTGNGTVNTVNVEDAASNVVSNNNGVAGAALTIGNLTFNGAATVNTFSSSTSAPIVITSLASNAAGTVTINPTAANFSAGTYDLISYGAVGGAGLGQFVLGTVTGASQRQSQTFGNSPTAITLTVGADDPPYWVGNGDGKWNTASISNWKLISDNSDTTFLSQDNVLFNDDATGAGPIAVDIDTANVAPTSTTFDNPTKDYVLGSTGGFGISSGSLTKTGAGKLTISTINTYTGSTTVNGGTLEISGTGNIYGTDNGLTATGTVTVASGAQITLSGTAGNALGFGVNQLWDVSGTINSTGGSPQSLPGNVILNNGTLSGASNATFGTYFVNNTSPTKTITANGATNTIDAADIGITANGGVRTLTLHTPLATDALSISSVLGVASEAGGGLTKIGLGSVTLSGASIYTGPTTISAGTLLLSGSGTLGNGSALTLSGGALDLGGNSRTVGAVSITAPAASGDTIGNGTLTGSSYAASNTSGTVTISAALGGTGGFTKTGAGSVTLSGANGFTGAVTVSAGTLTLSGGNSGIAAANYTVGSTGNANVTLAITGGSYDLGTRTLTVGTGSALTDTGAVNQSDGTVTITATSQNGLLLGNLGATGTYNLSGGTLNVSHTNPIRGVMLGVNENSAGNFNLSGTGILNVSGNAILMVGRSDAAAFSTTNTYNQTGGTASVANLSIGGFGTAHSMTNTFSVTGGSFTATEFDSLGGGSGTGNTTTLTVGGTAVVTLPNFPAKDAAHTVDLYLDGGTLKNSVAGTFIPTTALTAAYIKAGGANFDTTENSTTVDQPLLHDPALGMTLDGGLTKSGANTLTLTGDSTYTGATAVAGGTLLINNTTGSGTGTGNVAVNTGTLGGTGGISGAVTIGDGSGSADALLAPGASIESLATGALTFGSDGSYSVEVDGTSATSDQTLVTGAVTLNAATTLSVNVTGTLVAGQKYFIVVNDDADPVSGTFATFGQDSVVGTFGGKTLKISYTGDSVGNTTTGGNDIALYVEGGASAYDGWAALNGLTGLPGSDTDPAKDADPDNDGSNNLAEFALNGDPLSGSDNGMVAGLVQDASLPAGDELTLVIAVRNGAGFSGTGSPTVQTATVAADGVTYTIEGTLDLTTIPGSAVSHVAGPLNTAPAGSGLTVDLSSADWKYHVFKLDASEGLPGKGFLRARVSE